MSIRPAAQDGVQPVDALFRRDACLSCLQRVFTGLLMALKNRPCSVDLARGRFAMGPFVCAQSLPEAVTAL